MQGQGQNYPTTATSQPRHNTYREQLLAAHRRHLDEREADGTRWLSWLDLKNLRNLRRWRDQYNNATALSPDHLSSPTTHTGLGA